MGRSLLILLLLGSFHGSQAQIIPNGGFEEWNLSDTVPYPYPFMWRWTHVTTDPLCPLPASESMEPSLVSSSGSYSIKLTTSMCQIGFVFSSGGSPSPSHWAFECMARPAQLNFQYMFAPIGGDSAFVKILLFNYDSVTPDLNFWQRLDTAAFASGYIPEGVNSFTPFTLPINYLNEDIPAFMHILFSTSKTASETYFLGYGPPSSSASIGTSFWVDDVHLSGTVGIQDDPKGQAIAILPNPAGDRIWFQGLEDTGEVNALVFDAKGAQVMDQGICDPKVGLDVGPLRPGIYTVVLISGSGGSMRATFIKD
jgi:hypothetical protein